MDNQKAIEFGLKIKNIREQKRFSLRQVSQQSKSEDFPEISPSYWSLIERGKRNIPKPDTIKRMARGLRMNPDELLELAGYVVNKTLPSNIIPVDVNSLIDIPVIGTIKAGPNGLAMQDHLGMEFVNKDDIDMSYDYFWLVVSGDSMTGDGIYDKDYAMIKRTTEFNNGDICAVIVDGEEGTLKHVTKSNNSIVLTASNPIYPPRIFTGNDMNEILIAGRLVQTKRKY